MNYKEYKKIQYTNDRELAKKGGTNIDDWSNSPYTCLKTRFYIEGSSLLLHALRKCNIHPSDITLLYAFCGIIVIPLLASNQETLIYIGLVITFAKGIFDWADGTLARTSDQTSNQGHILDSWGAYVNALGFRIGLALYIFNETENIIYLYVILLIAFFRGTNLKNYANSIMFEEGKSHNFEKNKKNDGDKLKKDYQSIIENIKVSFFSIIDDDRARSIDFICLIVFFETNEFLFFTPIILIFMGIQEFIKWLGYLYRIRFTNSYNDY